VSGVCGVWHRAGAPAGEALAALSGAAPYRGTPERLCAEGVGLAFLETGTRGASGVRRADHLVVAQSRLDNKGDLVPSLRAHGVTPASSDAEVILAAYERWGTDCAQRLIGDFAFAIWDDAEQQLFAARDPMAMRPFYYYSDAKRFAFASEISQLLAAGVPKRINETMVALYLAGRFDPLDLTFYEGIKQLEPAHALLVTTRGVNTWRYWDLDPERRLRYRRDQDYAEHFRELFLTAVHDRVKTDKPIGLFLSGGVDSGTLASAIGWLKDSGVNVPDVHAISFAFPSFPECDERAVSDAIADHYGFHKHTVDMDRAYPLAGYPEHGPSVDEPFIGAYQAALEDGLSQVQALGAGLMMGGDRGDLLVGDVLFDPLGMLAAGRPHRAWREFADLQRWRGGPRKVILNYAIKPLALGLREGYYRRTPDHPVTRMPAWLSPELTERTQLKDRLLALPIAAPFGSVRGLRYELFLIPFHMRGVAWSERTQARFGLEFADAFSDRRLLEFVLAIPQWVVQRSNAPKAILQEALKDAVPKVAQGRLRKVSPGPLYEAALRDYAYATVTDLLTGSRAAAHGFIEGEVLSAVYENACSGAALPPEFWWALTLEMWLRERWS
jgi:asparagine synthase (glutamine-hydrolysing)